MSGVLARYTKGLIDSGEYAAVMLPDDWAGDGTKGVVAYCGGVGAGAMNVLGAFNRYDIVEAGYPVVSTDLGDTPTTFTGTNGPGVWGSDVAVLKLADLLGWVTSELGAAEDGHVLLGGSHGAASALRLAHDAPLSIAGVACFIGAIDTEDIRVNNRGGYATSIGAAIGSPVPDAKNPARLAVTWPTSVPVRLWYSTTDSICVQATQTAFNADAPVGADVDAISFGDHGHTTQGLPWTDITSFLLDRLNV